MSEEANTPIVESDSTLTPEPEQQELSPDKILEYLNSALVELKETGDYLSYATLIEIHLQSKQDDFDTPAKNKILRGLLEILKDNTDIVYEIGWDLPSLLLDYLYSQWDLEYTLKANPGICAIIKIFELLALYGNPKEIFLRSCELLNACKFEDIKFEKVPETWGDEFYPKLASHNLIELLNSSLTRIKTRYPSRFLSKLIITLINFLNTNFEFLFHTRSFIFRRYYVFIRQYSGLPLPDDVSGIDPEELSKTIEDEDYLQRKLLTSFLTHFISIAMGPESMNWTYDYYNQEFHNPNSKFRLPGASTATNNVNNDQDDPYGSVDSLLLRCAQLGQSMDLDLEELFAKQISDCNELFSKLDHNKSMDLLNDEVYSLVINDFNLKSKPQKTIPMSDQGILYLVTQLVLRDPTYKGHRRVLPVDIESIIKLTIRSIIPTLINPSLSSRSLIDDTLFWSWYTVKNDANFSQSLKKIKPVFIHIYLQTLISLSSVNPNPAIRIIIFTLITKILTLAKEELSFEFIMESVETCPYDNAKLALIGILKDLLIIPKTINKLSDSLGNLQINEDKPKLPPREIPTYIQLTSTRKLEILKSLDKQVENFFQDKDKNKIGLSIVLSYVNLLIAIKLKLTRDEIDKVVTKVEKNVEIYKKTDGAKDDLNIEFLLVATEALKK